MPINLGELGIERIHTINQVLLFKWIWLFIINNNSLWASSISGIHNFRNTNSISFPLAGTNSPWGNICKAVASPLAAKFLSGIKLKVGDGATFGFWSDPWCENTPLKDLFPRLFLISASKDARISDCFTANGAERDWNLSWTRSLRAWEEDQVTSLQLQVRNCIFNPTSQDKIYWEPGDDGLYIVKTMRRMVFDKAFTGNQPLEELKLIWKFKIPLKVQCFLWIALQDRLQTRDNLIRSRSLDAWDCLCPLCGDEDETVSHILLHCRYASKVWRYFLRLTGKSWVTPYSIAGALVCWRGDFDGKMNRDIDQALFRAITWGLWLARNKVIFEEKISSIDMIINKVLFHAKEWLIWSGSIKSLCNQDLTLYFASQRIN